MNTFALHLIALYQKFFSPLAGFLGAQCRFYPSCSEYARRAFQDMPFWKASGLVLWRLARCGPWSGGGVENFGFRISDCELRIGVAAFRPRKLHSDGAT